MNTKKKGDIAVSKFIFESLKKDWDVAEPFGDHLPYDLILDIQGILLKIQVKSAWFDENSQNWITDNRRMQTNRKEMKVSSYSEKDFDIAAIYIDNIDIFYIMPVEVFISYSGPIHLVEADKRQRKPKSSAYRDAWNLIPERALQRETFVSNSVKFREAGSEVILSETKE